MNAVEQPFSFRTYDPLTGHGDLVEVAPEHIESARQLIEEGWYQVSRKYRTLARLPDGMTGVEALIHGCRKTGYPNRDPVAWAEGMGNAHAGGYYLRRQAQQDLNWCELDIPTFAAFRKLGGTTYTSWYYQTHETTR